MKEDVILFLKRALLFVALIFMTDSILGYGLKKLYFIQKKGQFAQTTYAVDSTYQDILIFGSSRATRHYKPDIFSSKIKMSCYNGGRDGQMIPFSAALEDVTFKRYIPKIILLDINPWELSKGRSKYEKLSILFPYFNYHPELESHLDRINKGEKYKLLSKTYAFNSSLFISLNNFILEKRLPKENSGYLPLTGIMTKEAYEDYLSKSASINASEFKNNSLDTTAVNLYTSFLKKARKHGIKTFVFISPCILNNSFNPFKKNLIKQIALEEGAAFYDYSGDSRFNNNYTLFSDIFHLNNVGAEIYTKLVADNLQVYNHTP